jgi:hypothetical protein
VCRGVLVEGAVALEATKETEEKKCWCQPRAAGKGTTGGVRGGFGI